MNIEKIKTFFWKRVVLSLILAPLCMLPFGLNEDGHRVFWSFCSIISGLIMLNSVRYGPTSRSFSQHISAISFAALTGLFLLNSLPQHEFNLFWQFFTPWAIITSFLGTMYLNPKEAEKIVPDSFLKIMHN